MFGSSLFNTLLTHNLLTNFFIYPCFELKTLNVWTHFDQFKKNINTYNIDPLHLFWPMLSIWTKCGVYTTISTNFYYILPTLTYFVPFVYCFLYYIFTTLTHLKPFHPLWSVMYSLNNADPFRHILLNLYPVQPMS